MSNTLQGIKQRFGIIGNTPALNRALEIASQVAATDLSVLVTGESGSGKEIMPQVIHALSNRKHGPYIAVNCGAIPEGTIDSELFGHEKGSFTGAVESRKGYFEVANGGTIFLDEVAELPLQTQARLLRVLETGEYIRVGSSKVMKTDVRIIAATNVRIPEAIRRGKFREDLFYRLNTVPIFIPPLRERKEDIHLLFRKFAADFADKYRMPAIKLNDDALEILNNYSWPGNIRQLKNITEQISVIESEREITAEILLRYLPKETKDVPLALGKENDYTEREILYKVLFDMRNELNELKAVVYNLMHGRPIEHKLATENLIPQLENEAALVSVPQKGNIIYSQASQGFTVQPKIINPNTIQEHEEIEESLSLQEKEKDMIKKALIKHKNRRKNAANELGISERTLYRKIKEYNLKH